MSGPIGLHSGTTNDHSLHARSWQQSSTNGPFDSGSRLEQLQQQQDLIDRARAEADRTGDTQLANLADQLERDYQAREMAVLARAVYGNEPVPGYLRASDLPAQELRDQYGLTAEMLNPSGSDFRAELFIPDPDVFGPHAQPVLSFRGTQTEQDWINNFLQGTGNESDHYNRAMDTATALANTYRAPFQLTGHSLGGGLASAAAAVSGQEATTFNAAGLHENTAARHAEANGGQVFDAHALTTAYQVEGDILTSLQEVSGDLHPAVANRIANLVKLTTGLSDNRIIQSTPLAESLEQLRPLLSADGETLRNMPEAVGTHVRLDAMIEHPSVPGGFVARPDITPLGGPGGIIRQADALLHIGTGMTEAIRLMSTPGAVASDLGNRIDTSLDWLGQRANQGVTTLGTGIDGLLDGAGQISQFVFNGLGYGANQIVSGGGSLLNDVVTGAGQGGNWLISNTVGRLPWVGGAADSLGNALEHSADALGNGAHWVFDQTGNSLEWTAQIGGSALNWTADQVGNVVATITDEAGNAIEIGAGATGDGIAWTGDFLEVANLVTSTAVVGTAAGAVALGTPIGREMSLNEVRRFMGWADSIGEMANRHLMSEQLDVVTPSLDHHIQVQERALLERLGQ